MTDKPLPGGAGRIGTYPVARVGYGSMQLSETSLDDAVGVLRRAVELGVDHIDTAQFYGPDVANELIREALAPYPDTLALVSKVGARRDDNGGWLPAHEPDDLRRDIEVNLAALGVDQLAAVNLRVMDPEAEPDQPARVNRELFDRQLAAMIDARDQGLIAGVGLSNISLEHLQIALEATEIVCVQNAYNLVDRTSQPMLDACAEAGIAFVPYFPLGSGFAADNPVLGNPVVRRTAERLGHTPAQIALAWTLAVSPNVLLIGGTSSVGHLEENMAVADVELDEDTVDELTSQTA
jgi:pyridoxine 4-dehydrogenase